MKRKKTKALGQHFLKNPRLLAKIVQCIAPEKDDLIIEIGAGKGALTFPLAEKAGRVIAVERDSTLIHFLRERQFQNLEILEDDILKVRFKELVQKEKYSFDKVKVVGNLPYSISSPLLFKILEEKETIGRCVFLLQREVVERICGQPGTKKYAPLSIIFQIYFETHLHFIVSPKSFTPPPKVESALLSLEKRVKPLFHIEKEEAFLRFLRGVFRHRRKTLFNNLLSLGYERILVGEAFKEYALEKSIRPEQLSPAQFFSLYTFFFKKPLPGSIPKAF